MNQFSEGLPSGRRLLLGAAGWMVVALAAGCSGNGPDHEDAVQQISERIRASFPMDEQRLENVTFKKSSEIAGGRYAVLVDYDLVATLPDLSTLSVAESVGTRTHIVGERYVFVRSSLTEGRDWVLEQNGDQSISSR
jgi:hypothetical protein